MDWLASGSRRPHPGCHELGLRGQDHFQAVFGLAIGIEDEDVLRAGADVDGEDALVVVAIVRGEIGHMASVVRAIGYQLSAWSSKS